MYRPELDLPFTEPGLFFAQALDKDSVPPGLQPAPAGQASTQGSQGTRDMTEIVQPGQPVEFTVSASSQENTRNRGGRAPKYMARQASNLLSSDTGSPVLLMCSHAFSFSL